MIETAESERPSTAERYATARSASDLTVSVHRRTAADILLAAGTSHTMLSAALTALRSEWDRTAKVPKMTDAQIQDLADSYRPKPEPKKALKRARAEALVWHARQLREQAHRLPHRAEVVELLMPWVIAKNIAREQEAEAMIWLAVFHWLAPQCPVCDGRGGLPEAGTPVIKYVCTYCNGAKIWPEPLGSYRIKAYIRDSVNNAHIAMRQSHAKVKEMKRLASDGDNRL